MKKVLALSFALFLCVSLSVSAFAGYTVGADGNAVYDTAIGYVFGIDSINGKISGEDATICTSSDNLANCGVWAIWFAADKVSDHIYVATTDGAAMGGSSPSVKLKDGQIIVVIHSSTSNPDQASSYPNWEDKVAALAIKTGDYFYFQGVEIDAGTVTDGKMTCMTKADAEKINDGATGTSEPASDDTTSEEASAAVSDETSEAASASDDATSEAASAAESAESKAESGTTSEMTTEGFPTWAWIAIAAGVVIIIVVVVIVVTKKKK